MIFSTPSRFEPALQVASNRSGPALWFVFHKNNILVIKNTETQEVSIPLLEHATELGLIVTREQYLGLLNGVPCYAAEAAYEALTNPTLEWMGLRSLFSLVDDELFAISGRAFQIIDWHRTHQFCGRCGHKNVQKEGERCLRCHDCGQLHYPRVAPAIMVMVQREKDFLLARSPHFIPGMYSALAGFSEPGETLEETLEREVFEEVGVRVNNIRYFASQPWPFPHSLMIAFHADYVSGEITPDPQEIEDAGWFNVNKLPEKLPSPISISRKLIDATIASLT
jgi:NAD+ diphosphatase